MQPEKTEYAGWKNCLRLSNGTVELVVTLDVGPRVIRFGFVDGQNLFKEFEEQVGKTGGDEWHSYGGHRLWHAPEVEPRTYFPDNRPVAYDWDGTTLTLTPPEEESNRLQLAMEITLDMSDPRFTWGQKYIQMREDPSINVKQKIGALNTKGWAAYLLNGEAFIKHFPYQAGATYPDLNCNCEFYTEPGFLEVETLGPLAQIAPGETAVHPERWQISRLDTDFSEASLDKDLLALVESVPTF